LPELPSSEGLGSGAPSFSWRPLTSGVPQAFIIGPFPLSLFINDLDDGTEHTFSKLTDNTNLGGVADTSGGCVLFKRTLRGWRDLQRGTSCSSTKGNESPAHREE